VQVEQVQVLRVLLEVIQELLQPLSQLQLQVVEVEVDQVLLLLPVFQEVQVEEQIHMLEQAQVAQVTLHQQVLYPLKEIQEVIQLLMDQVVEVEQVEQVLMDHQVNQDQEE
tara:strand:+ start:37 stop:369 length:333 start_codon:yes stop_codon:yes gene_type:complete